jgi:CheY-like chemotaxis protein
MVIGEVLAEIGYRVVEAADGPSGLRIIQAGGHLDLLITDVGLPNGLNGRQVADAARVFDPKLKVLFITGFADNAAVGNGHLDAGMSIITKPFSNAALVNKVREIIDSAQ